MFFCHWTYGHNQRALALWQFSTKMDDSEGMRLIVVKLNPNSNV